MMKHKVEELEGTLLDAAVAKAEGWILHPLLGDWRLPPTPDDEVGELQAEPGYWKPSTAWDHGGPLLERECIVCWPVERWETRNLDPIEPPQNGWNALHPENKGLGGFFQSGTVDVTERDGLFGPTLLIAAMRAYVAAKLGDEVELP